MSGRRNLACATAIAATAVALASPPAVSAGVVGDVLNDVHDTVHGLTGGGGDGGGGGDAPAPAPPPVPAPPVAPAPEPAPAAQAGAEGTAVAVDVDPGEQNGDEVAVGRSRATQDDDGNYHGEVTILSVFGIEIPLFETRATDEGESDDGPLGDLNGALDGVCSDTEGGLCLNVLDVDSDTRGNGTDNSFAALEAGAQLGDESIAADALTSDASISDDGETQTSEAASEGAGLQADSGTLDQSGELHVLDSATSSSASRDGSTSNDSDSAALEVQGEDVPVPVQGCDGDDAVSTEPVAGVECGAGSSEADDPGAGASENAVDAAVLPGEDGGLASAQASSTETAATAPSKAGGDDPGDDDGGNDDGDGDDGNGGSATGGGDGDGEGQGVLGEGGAGTNGPLGAGPSVDSKATGGTLPFTGADLGILALFGIGAILTGLAAMAIADRRRRAPTR